MFFVFVFLSLQFFLFLFTFSIHRHFIIIFLYNKKMGILVQAKQIFNYENWFEIKVFRYKVFTSEVWIIVYLLISTAQLNTLIKIWKNKPRLFCSFIVSSMMFMVNFFKSVLYNLKYLLFAVSLFVINGNFILKGYETLL